MSSAMVGNGYQQNYNTYNGQPAPSHGQNYNTYNGQPPPDHGQNVTSPRRGVFYRLVSPEVGLPLGRYEDRRKSLDDQRQRDYFEMMSQKEKKEHQKRQEESMKKQAHVQKLQMQPEQKLYNYDEVQKSLREERRKEYDEFVKLKEEQSKLRPVPTPPGGLDVGQNDLYRQHLKDDLMREYQASLKKKEQNPSPRRMPTPPHGLDIVSQSERTRQAREKQRLYGQELQKQTQEQMFKKIQNNISVIDRTGQLPPAPSQYNQVAPQQHGMAPPQASPSSRNIAPPHPPQQAASPPPQHQMLPPPQHSQMVPQSTQPQFMLPPQSPKKPPPLHHTQFDESQYMDHHVAAPPGSHSPPPRQRSRPTPQRTEHGYHQEFNGKQQSPMESRDGHRPPPHPRRHATPDRPEWARGPPPRQNGTPTGRASLRRDDRQTPSYWNSGMPVRSPATTPSTRTPSTQHSNRTLTPKDSQDNIPDIHLESYRKNPFEEFRRGERKKEYNDFLIQKEIKAQSKREELEQLRRQAPVQPKYDNYSSSDNHQRHKKHLETERHEQYQSFLSQNGEPVYTNTRTSELTQSRLSGGLVGGIFGDVQHEQDRRRVMVQQRNKEYNQLKKQSNSREPTEEFDRTVPQLGLPLDNERSNELRRRQEKVRNREYRKFLEENVMNNSREQPHEPSRRGPEFGLPLDNRKSNELRRQQERDRNQEYRSFLEEKKRSPRRYQPPTPEDKQGLPLTQRPYDERKVFNERQRNMEYNQYLAKSGLPFDKMSLQGSVQGSAVARQANDLQTDTEPPTPQKRYPSKKHDREVTHRVEDEKKKKKGEVPRKQGDPSMDEKNMFSDMGKSQEAHKKRIQENAKQDYRNYVNHDSWYDAQPPTHRRSPPRDFRPEPENHQRHSHDAYAERLQQARANEAMYRKHDPQMNDHRQRQSAPRQEQAPYALY